MDTGTIVVVGAVLIFYLRLIVIQRQRARRIRQTAQAPAAKKTGKKKATPKELSAPPRYSILSQDRRDWAIAGCGALAIAAGILLNANLIPYAPVQAYWWLPVAVGIVAFSWAFRG